MVYMNRTLPCNSLWLPYTQHFHIIVQVYQQYQFCDQCDPNDRRTLVSLQYTHTLVTHTHTHTSHTHHTHTGCYTFIGTLTDRTYIVSASINKPTVWTHICLTSITSQRSIHSIVHCTQCTLNKVMVMSSCIQFCSDRLNFHVILLVLHNLLQFTVF